MQAVEYNAKILSNKYIPLIPGVVDELHLKKGEKIRVIIMKEEKQSWEEGFEKTLAGFRAGTKGYSSKEVERDINEAISQVRSVYDKGSA